MRAGIERAARPPNGLKKLETEWHVNLKRRKGLAW
jgi:hypothetical protein